MSRRRPPGAPGEPRARRARPYAPDMQSCRLQGTSAGPEPFKSQAASAEALRECSRRFWCEAWVWRIFGDKLAGDELPSMLNVDDLFKGRHFDREIIVLCVRWYLRYKLSFRDLVEMMAERGLSLAHTTIMRWIQRYAPEFDKRWNRFARPVGQSWRVDETYVKIKGRWTYLYRAVDKEGKTVDVLLGAKRDVAAAKAYFRRAFRGQGRLPHKITLDGYQASHRAAKEVLGDIPREIDARSDPQNI